MNESCPFCMIVAGEIPADIVYSDDFVVGFADLNPQAPHHYLFVPRKHITSLADAQLEDTDVLGQLLQAAKSVAHERGFAQNGFRVVMNCNQDGGQTVYHIHLHCLGGRALGWPPG